MCGTQAQRYIFLVWCLNEPTGSTLAYLYIRHAESYRENPVTDCHVHYSSMLHSQKKLMRVDCCLLERPFFLPPTLTLDNDAFMGNIRSSYALKYLTSPFLHMLLHSLNSANWIDPFLCSVLSQPLCPWKVALLRTNILPVTPIGSLGVPVPSSLYLYT
jgi:hypothetical protein